MTTPTVTNTELSQRLLAIFDVSLSRRSKARTKANREAKKQQKKASKNKKQGAAQAEEDKGPHVDANAPLRGVLGKGDGYAKRGWEYIKSKDGRGVYRNFDYPHLDEIRDLVRKHAEFPGGPKENFDDDFKQGYPYKWQAHHMLPGSAFYQELNGKPVFSFLQLRLILQCDYNINHGHNIIFLPEETWASPVHTLIRHLGDHEAYTQMVMTSLKSVADEIQKKIDAAQPHDAIKVDLFEQLKRVEERFWRVIVSLSRVSVTSACKGIKFTHELIKWESGKKPLEFPNLN